MKNHAYRLEGVGYGYGDVEALKGINMTVLEGECLAVVGTNGSGKSTLLKILDGLYVPAAGRVSFFGETLDEGYASTTAFRQRVGLVFQEPDVQLFSPTVRDEAAFGPLQLGLTEGEVTERVDGVLGMLGLGGLELRPPHTLSSGEKKKVAIASVLAINPEVLLLDEPTTGLDPRTQVWLLSLIEELKGLKKTIVVATHDLSLVEDIADRVVVLNELHSIAAEGKTKDILGDKSMLLKVNLIHEHAHRHGEVVHTHTHAPFSVHDEHK